MIALLMAEPTACPSSNKTLMPLARAFISEAVIAPPLTILSSLSVNFIRDKKVDEESHRLPQ